MSKKYKYEIGYIFGKGTLEIVGKIRMGKANRKGYVVQSVKYPCAPTYEIFEYNVDKNVKCGYTESRRIFEGNSLWSIEEIRKYIVDTEQAKTIPPHHRTKIKVKCNECQTVKMLQPATLVDRGIMCPVCNTNTSYGQLAFGQYNEYFNLGFESEKILPNLPNRRVDFINWDNGMWVEIQGEQHTNPSSTWYESAHEQDLEKREFAKNNSKYNLIEIDMRISSWEYFKEQINNCEYLPNITDEDEKAIIELMKKNKKYPTKEIIDLYTVKLKSTVEIGRIFKINNTTVGRILRKSGIDMRKGGKQGVPSHNRIDFSEQEVKDIIELHINKKMSAYKISKKI